MRHRYRATLAHIHMVCYCEGGILFLTTGSHTFGDKEHAFYSSKAQHINDGFFSDLVEAASNLRELTK